MKIWWGCCYLATDLVSLTMTKNAEKKIHKSQKIGRLDGIKVGEGQI